MARKRYLIVGDGAAGITAAETLRRLDASALIGLFTDDPNPGYYRAALTNYLLGELREDQLWAAGPDFYETRKLHRVFARVASVDTTRGELWDSVGSAPVAYDQLIIAAGARPRPPSFEGAHLPGVLTLRTIQDVREIVDRLRVHRVGTAAVLGGGPLGLEWAHGLREHGVKVTILERSPRFMPRVLDETASHLLATRLKQAGIDVVFGEQVASAYASRTGSVGAITTNAGRAISCELLAVAMGVVCNTEFLQGSAIERAPDGGVRVNRRMQSSVPNVWAAGDCASVDGQLLQLWEPARLQGRIAAQNIAGSAASYEPGAHYFATRLFDLDFASVGSAAPDATLETVVDMPRGTGAIAYRKLVLKDGRLVGALLMGERQARVRALGRTLKRLIDAKIDVRNVRSKLLSPTFDIEGWLGTRKLLESPPAPAQTSALPAAKLRGTQLIDLNLSPGLKTEVVTHLAESERGTVALPFSTLAIPSGAALAAAELGAPFLLQGATHMLADGAGRGTRVLSIGLHAETAQPVAAPVQRIQAALEGYGRTWPLGPGITRIGGAPECEVRLNDVEISSLHAEITQHGSALYLRDMGSRTGTWINGSALSSAHKLADCDQIRFGNSELLLRAPELGKREEPRPTAHMLSLPRLEFRSGAAFGLSFVLREEPRIIGRAASCSIRIDELSLSLEHASVRAMAGAHSVTDLGSESGTFVAGARLAPAQEAALGEGVALRFGAVDALYTRAPRAAATHALAPAARLHVEAGAELGRSIPLGLRALVGSQAGCDLQIAGAAPVQLEIAANPRGFFARDVARGGVFRAGAPLGSEYAQLSHGDLLLLGGGVMLRFEEAQ